MKQRDDKEDLNHDLFTRIGGQEGIRVLVDCFYDIMDDLPEARRIRDMHPPDLGPIREKLSLFLCGWLGGPALYREKYGPINLTGLHSFLNIDIAERDMWLSCMKQALDKQPISDDLKEFLLERFRVPAARICAWCQQQRLQATGPSPALQMVSPG